MKNKIRTLIGCVALLGSLKAVADNTGFDCKKFEADASKLTTQSNLQLSNVKNDSFQFTLPEGVKSYSIKVNGSVNTGVIVNYGESPVRTLAVEAAADCVIEESAKDNVCQSLNPKRGNYYGLIATEDGNYGDNTMSLTIDTGTADLPVSDPSAECGTKTQAEDIATYSKAWIFNTQEGSNTYSLGPINSNNYYCYKIPVKKGGKNLTVILPHEGDGSSLYVGALNKAPIIGSQKSTNACKIDSSTSDSSSSCVIHQSEDGFYYMAYQIKDDNTYNCGRL